MMHANTVATALREAGIIPILTVKDLNETLKLVSALVDGGIRAVEIVLRTEPATEAIRLVRQAFPDLLVAAGTVMGPAAFDRAVEAGANLIVSPGLTPELADYHRRNPIPMIPGALTASEVMWAVDRGYTLLKYYPAVPSNGAAVLADYGNIFSGVSFMPTGKISLSTLPDFARLKNVACIGGSWMFSGPLEAVAADVRQSIDVVRKARATVSAP